MRPSPIRTSRTRLPSGGRVRVRWWRTAVVLVLTGAAACADRTRAQGPGGSDTPPDLPRPPATIEVEIRAFEYRPAVIRVVPGDTVRWTNHDIVPHTVTGAERGAAANGTTEGSEADSGGATAPESMTASGGASPPGHTADRWDSGEIMAGGSYERVVAATDAGAYYCRYHPTMTATLEREDADGMER